MIDLSTDLAVNQMVETIGMIVIGFYLRASIAKVMPVLKTVAAVLKALLSISTLATDGDLAFYSGSVENVAEPTRGGKVTVGRYTGQKVVVSSRFGLDTGLLGLVGLAAGIYNAGAGAVRKEVNKDVDIGRRTIRQQVNPVVHADEQGVDSVNKWVEVMFCHICNSAVAEVGGQ